MKFADVRQEHAMMCALLEMNRRWQEHVVHVCGVPVQALTYEIYPIGSSGGLIEAVTGCRTLRELKRLCKNEPQQRVFEALGGDGQKLDTLAASTTAYLTACYSLGVRDGHDDNIMLRDLPCRSHNKFLQCFSFPSPSQHVPIVCTRGLSSAI